MTTLLVLREKAKSIYARYGIHVVRILRFLLVCVSCLVVMGTMGYSANLSRIWIPVILGAACAFLPNWTGVFLVQIYVLGQLYAVSMETCLVYAALLVLMLCFYYVFQPGDSAVLLLMPLMFVCKIPLVMPIVLGLTGSMFSVIPGGFGVVLYYYLAFVKVNQAVLLSGSGASLSTAGRYVMLVNGLLSNQTMWIVLIAFTAAILVVYVIRRLSVDHSWKISIAAGVMTLVVLLLGAIFMLDIDLTAALVIIDAALAAGVGLVMEFLLFHVDYSRTEYVQFEDDDYYYYVKAVPKIMMTQPKLDVKTINEIDAKSREKGAGGEELFVVHTDPNPQGGEIRTAGKDLGRIKEAFSEQAPETDDTSVQ